MMRQLSIFTLRMKGCRRRIGLQQMWRLAWLLACSALVLIDVPNPGGSATLNATADQCLTRSGTITHTTIRSAVYAQPVSVSLYLPPCYESSTKPLPVLYLLHGANADETQWPDLRVQVEADALIANGAQPFVVVMPGGDYQAGLDYAAFVLTDLLPAMEGQLSIRTDAAGRAIGGISLGGYWALSIALHHPDQFAAVGGYSPVVANGPDDLAAFARAAIGLDRLRIQLDVGDADALAAGTQQLAETLHARALAVQLSINPGGHNRPYWRTRTGDELRFMLASFTAPVRRHACESES